MKAAVLERVGVLAVEDVAEPALAGEHDVKVAVLACGICGTDLHILSDPPGLPADLGVVLGHEFVGEVTDIGTQVTNVAVGDRVVVRPIITCGTCRHCLSGAPNHCTDMQLLGVYENGGLAEFVVVPDVACVQIQDSIPIEIAAMTEPLACVLNAVGKAALVPGERVVILGAGAIGLLFLATLRAAGAGAVVVVEPSEWRARVAKDMGATETLDPKALDVAAELENLIPGGADVVIDAVGSQLSVALSLAARRGRIILFGLNSHARAEVSQHLITEKELSILGSFIGQQSFPEAIRLLESGTVDLAPIASHVYRLEDLADSMSEIRGGTIIKAIVKV